MANLLTLLFNPFRPLNTSTCAFTEYLSRFGVSNVQKIGLGATKSYEIGGRDGFTKT